ncbi:MAG: hypothetical protein U0228_17255 [Myxococcaceae bacterium]
MRALGLMVVLVPVLAFAEAKPKWLEVHGEAAAPEGYVAGRRVRLPLLIGGGAGFLAVYAATEITSVVFHVTHPIPCGMSICPQAFLSGLPIVGGLILTGQYPSLFPFGLGFTSFALEVVGIGVAVAGLIFQEHGWVLGNAKVAVAPGGLVGSF